MIAIRIENTLELAMVVNLPPEEAKADSRIFIIALGFDDGARKPGWVSYPAGTKTPIVRYEDQRSFCLAHSLDNWSAQSEHRDVSGIIWINEKSIYIATMSRHRNLGNGVSYVDLKTGTFVPEKEQWKIPDNAFSVCQWQICLGTPSGQEAVLLRFDASSKQTETR